MSHLKNMRVLAATLILMLLLANAAYAELACIMSDTTVYAAPDTSSKAVGISAGTLLELKAEKGGWAMVERDGNIGYIKASDISEIKAFNGMTVYLSEDASLLKNFTQTSVAKSLSKGDKVKLYATAGDWAYVKSGSKSGFVKTASLTADKPEPEAAMSVTAYAKTDGAKVYKSYSTSSKVIGKLPVNTEVTVVAVKGDWCRVTKDGYSGFMKKSALSDKKVEVATVSTFTAYAKEDGVKVYDGFSSSASVVGTLSLNDAVTVTAYTDSWCRVSAGSKVAFVRKDELSATKIEVKQPEKEPEKEPDQPKTETGSSAKPAKGTSKEMDWWTSDIRSIFSVGTVATITDVETGISWREKRSGGTNHADVQPLTAADTAAFKSAVGSWSWERRAVFVTIDGVNYAASINCMPHGSGSITDNNFNGHHCIHFTNSRTHGGNKVCPLHQGAIQKAAKASL